ncbi:MAG: helix-turn-helix domain-containing protein [Rhodospirillales bacterium]|nr:helix-turn-helix domain-containing protein [Rhodospirillales bacterium]MCB9994847.1 helix-turn-helix domain-containing protein [Rhodospirillales bacterium]
MDDFPKAYLGEEDRGVTIKEACEILGYSRWTIERMIKRGELIAYGKNKKKRIHLSSITQYRSGSRAVADREIEAGREIKRVSKRHKKALKQLEELLK